MWIGFTVLRNLIGDCHGLDCFNCGLWIWTQQPVYFFFCLPSLFTLSHLSTIFHFFQLSPSLSIFINLPFLSLNYLSFTQGQRHEESAGFPTEEEWIPRKQPCQQVRQIYEVSQVSGHFLTACVWMCVWGRFPELATTGDDLALKDRHVGRSRDGSFS